MSAAGNTSTAVKNQRAPSLVEADDATRALWRKLDWFATPPWASRAGAEIVKALDPGASHVHEPACGDGIMAAALRETFASVLESDIHPQTPDLSTFDFLKPGWSFADEMDWVITNPPFGLAVEFARRGLEVATRGVALLCRLNWLESAERYALFAQYPLTLVAPFCERVPMQLGPWDPACSSATAYAWFVWKKAAMGAGALPKVHFIPPGTRARLSKPDDVRRFCKAADAPLFEAAP